MKDPVTTFWKITIALACLLLLPVIIARVWSGNRVLTLDNGKIRVGASLKYGGAITYLSLSREDRNLINDHDRGRQVQQSYYAGQDIDRKAEGQRKNWSPWPWNPIGAGDAYGNKPRIVSASNDGKTVYVKIVPLLWDMKNEFAECYFESWINLQDNAVHVRNKLTCFRRDDKWKAVPKQQELPAMYTIADLSQLYTYEGPAPFTHAPLTSALKIGPPWTDYGRNMPHEKWAALADAHQWGVGIYNPIAEIFAGGIVGKPGGDTKSDSTGYLSPLRTETFDKNSVYQYDYYIIVGTVNEIRDFVYKAEGKT